MGGIFAVHRSRVVGGLGAHFTAGLEHGGIDPLGDEFYKKAMSKSISEIYQELTFMEPVELENWNGWDSFTG